MAGMAVLFVFTVAMAQPTTLQELQDCYPQVPDNENAALVYQKAMEAYVIDAETEEDLPILGVGEFPDIPVKRLDPDLREILSCELRKNRETLRLLRQASAMPRCRYPIDLTNLTLPHLAQLRALCRLLLAQAVLAADQGKKRLATQSVLDMTAIAQSLRNEPLLISQQVRMGCGGMANVAIEQVVNRVQLNDQSLLALQESLETGYHAESMTRGFQGDLCQAMVSQQKLAKEEAESPGPWTAFRMQEKNDAVQRAREAVEQSRMTCFECINLQPQSNVPPGQSGPGPNRTIMLSARFVAKAAAAQGAIAFERYRLKRGTLPEKWEDLTPEFLPAPILDPFTKNSPMLFKTTDTGYVVYSVGQNGVDDGGIEDDAYPPLDYVFRVENRKLVKQSLLAKIAAAIRRLKKKSPCSGE